MKIDYRSIEAFKNISDSSIELIENDAEYLTFSMGAPVSDKEIIPNKILVILSGEARLLNYYNSKIDTISKLKSNDFIGLTSLLRARSCELVAASNKLLVLAISDHIIIKLYQEDTEFRNWCNSKISIAEIYEISIYFDEKYSRNDINLKDIVKLIQENISFQIIKNGDKVSKNIDCVSIAGSSNIVSKDFGELINQNELINTKGPFPAKILYLKESIFKQLNEVKPIIQSINNSLEEQDFSKLDTKEMSEVIKKTNIELGAGSYSPQKKSKVIRADGIFKESLACLQMLAYELDIPYRSDSIEKILNDSIKRKKKPNLQLLGGITSTMGLHSSMIRIDPQKADKLPHNSLITWKESFAIVKDSNTNLLEIISPSEGIIRINAEDFEASFDKGFIELLLVEKNEQTPEKKFGIEWLLPAIKRYRGVLLQVLLASFVVQLFGLANPLMIQVIIDKVIRQRSLDTLQILGIALVAVTILGGVISSLRTFLFTETTNRIDTRLGSEVIDHLLRLPLNYFDKRPVGELGSRISELEKIRNFLTGQALTTILDAAFSLIYIVVMVIYSWLLTLIALGVVPIQMLITLIGAPLIRRQIREIAQRNANTQSHLVEVLTGIQTVKAQNVELVSRWKWQELYSKYISNSFQKTITTSALGELSQVLQQLSQLLVLWIGATLVLKGELSLGQLIAFRIISGYVTQPLLRLSTIWQNIQELRVSFERLADIIDTPEEATETDKAKIPLPSIKGDIEFENIFFKFNQGQPNVINNINLRIKTGQFVGVVGQSGSGKSTLVKLLPRLYKPNSGRITIDGYDINKVELYSLRRQIGIVPQEPLLFAGTVNENIALTDPEAPSDEIVKAAKLANAHEFIMELKDGYSTTLGERGAGLSGGQKQRIAIARTLLNNPKLLIMDEATSALDYQTERNVCEGLRKSCKDATVFFITHRLSTVRNADLIVMLDQGAIVEKGTHQELIDLKGRYFALYSQQESS